MNLTKLALKKLFLLGLIPAWQLAHMLATSYKLRADKSTRELANMAAAFKDTLCLLSVWALHPSTDKADMERATHLLQQQLDRLGQFILAHFSTIRYRQTKGGTVRVTCLPPKNRMGASIKGLQESLTAIEAELWKLIGYDPKMRQSWINFHRQNDHPLLLGGGLSAWTSFARRFSLKYALDLQEAYLSHKAEHLYLDFPYLKEADARAQQRWDELFENAPDDRTESGDTDEPAVKPTSFAEAERNGYVMPFGVLVHTTTKGHLLVTASIDLGKTLSVEQSVMVRQLKECGAEGKELLTSFTTPTVCTWRTSPAELAQAVEMAEAWQAVTKAEVPRMIQEAEKLLDQRKRDQLLQRFTKNFTDGERALLREMWLANP